MADKPACEEVYLNDSIMVHILQMLSLNSQHKLLKVSNRFKFLIKTRVWTKNSKEIQMHRGEMSCLTDELFFEYLQLNADNVEKLTIDSTDGHTLLKYFPECFENLMELHIRGFSSRVETFAHLQYGQTWGSLRKITFRSVKEMLSYGDLYLLAKISPLEHLEMHEVQMCKSEWNVQNRALPLNGLKVLKIVDCPQPYECTECLQFIQKCPKLQQLQLCLPVGVDDSIEGEVFEKLKFLEVIILGRHCRSPQTIWSILRHANLKYFEFNGTCLPSDVNIVDFVDTDEEVGVNLQTLKAFSVGRQHFNSIFQNNLINLNNLEKLYLNDVHMDDTTMQLVVIKCPNLRLLNCSSGQIRGGISGKYVNELKNMRNLTLCFKNCCRVQCLHLFKILHDLNLLQQLQLSIQQLEYDYIEEDTSGVSLICKLNCLEINLTYNTYRFWAYILHKFDSSFQKLRNLIIGVSVNAQNWNYFCRHFPQLSMLHLTFFPSLSNGFLLPTSLPNLQHLILEKCYNDVLKWSIIVEFLRSSNVQILELYGCIDVDCHQQLSDTHIGILNHLRSVTIPIKAFEQTFQFWYRCLIDCPEFRLCCIIDYFFEACWILERLATNSANEVIRVKSIHVSKELVSNLEILQKCARNIAPISYFDADNKKLWNRRYRGKCIVIVEV